MAIAGRSLFGSEIVTSPLVAAFGAKDRTPATPLDAVDAVIAFANGEISPTWESAAWSLPTIERWASTRLEFLKKPENLADIKEVAAMRGIGPDEWLRKVGGEIAIERESRLKAAKAEATSAIENERALAREWLMCATRGASELGKKLRDLKSDAGDPSWRVQMVPALIPGAGSGAVWRLTGPHAAPPWIYFAGFVIVQESKGDKTNIGVCKWKECDKFFRILAKGRGKPATDYCPGTDHRERARPSSSDRVREWRRKKRQASRKPTRKSHK